MDLVIEPLRSRGEIDALLEIEQASFSNPWTRDMYEAELNNPDVSHFFLARNGEGRVVGFCSFWRIFDEIHVNNLAVMADVRRCGVAS